MSDSHNLALVDEGQYKKPTCSCGWEGSRRRANNTERARLDGNCHLTEFHRTALHCSPTIFDWTKVRGGCLCGWEGPWIERDYLAGAKAAAGLDAQRHHREMIEAAWGGIADEH